MAESYTQPGKSCSVTEFEAQERANRGSSWKAFCDCMFLKPVEIVVFKCSGVPIPIPPFISGDAARAKFAQDYCKASGGRYSLDVQIVPTKTDEWQKCVQNFCALPSGCFNTDAQVWMPLNVHPGAAVAPWTDAGAAARGIPKRNAGFFYTLTQVTSIDASAYEPLKMWRNLFENPALYVLNASKLALIPGVGSALAGALLAPFPINIAQLAPFALAQVAAERKDVMAYIIKPMIEGSIDTLGFGLKAIGPAIGGQYLEVAGLIVAKAAKDQVKTGEIDKVLDPGTKAAIIFFAENGEEIGRSLQRAIGGGIDTSSLTGVVDVLSRGFRAVANTTSLPADMRNVANSIANVMRVIYAIASGIRDKKPPLAIADDVVYEIFGFRLLELQRAVSKGATEVKTLLADAQAKGKSGTLDGARQALEAISAAFQKISETITMLSNAIGGGLEKFREQFAGFGALMQPATDAARTALDQAQHGALPVTSVTTSTLTKVPMLLAPSAQSTTGAAAPKEKQVNKAIPPVIGGVAGALVAGPIGAAAGAGAGVLIAKYMAPSGTPDAFSPPPSVQPSVMPAIQLTAVGHERVTGSGVSTTRDSGGKLVVRADMGGYRGFGGPLDILAEQSATTTRTPVAARIAAAVRDARADVVATQTTRAEQPSGMTFPVLPAEPVLLQPPPSVQPPARISNTGLLKIAGLAAGGLALAVFLSKR